MEYAKSNKSTCNGCDERIIKGETRISKKDFDSLTARKFAPLDRWYHLECFVKLRADLGYYGRGDELHGVNELSKEDRESLKTALPKIAQGKKEDIYFRVEEMVEHITTFKLKFRHYINGLLFPFYFVYFFI